jgi:glycosyltransferase involved in cell wall biosynthesis
MKILVALSEFHQGAGYPRYGAQMSLALARRGHEVTVLTRRAEIRDEDRILRFRSYRVPGRGVLVPMALEPWILTRTLRRIAGEFDVVISVGIPTLHPVVLVGLGTHRGYYRTSMSSLKRTSPRRWIEAVRPFHRVVMAWERAMLRRRVPQLVIVGGRRYAQEYPSIFGYPEDRVAIVEMGVEPEAFAFDAALRERTRAELGIAPETTVMLNIAGRSRQKGLDVLVEALRTLPDGDWTFLFAGDGSRAPVIEARTGGMRQRGRVRLLGRVADVRALYCAADLVVFPSRYDPWGLVTTEGLACGVPVVCSGTIGSAVAIEEGRNGTIVADPSDAAQIRDGIQRLLARARSFDRERVAASVAWLSWEAGAERLERLLGSVVSELEWALQGAGR